MGKRKKESIVQTPPMKPEKMLRLPPTALFIVLGLWVVFVFRRYFSVYPFTPDSVGNYFGLMWHRAFTVSSLLSCLMERAAGVLIAGGFFAGAAGWGKTLWRYIRSGEDDPLERLLFYIAIGLAFMLFILTAAGMAGYWIVPVILGVPAAGFILLVVPLAGKKAALPSAPVDTSTIAPWIAVALAACGIVTVFGTFAPETFYDSLSYHLTVPAYWLQEHALKPLWCHHQSYIVTYLHIPYGVAIAAGNDIAAKSVNAGFAVCTLAGIYALCRRWFFPRMGALAGALFFTVPVALMVSTRSALEYPLAFMELMALAAALRFFSISSEESLPWRWMMLAGIFSGISLASKYTGAGAVLGMAAAIIFWGINRGNLKRSLAGLAIFSLCVGVVISPWLIRNWQATGHPLYPFMLKSGGLGFSSVIQGQERAFNDMSVMPPGIMNFLLLPWNLPMGAVGQEGYMGAGFLILLPVLLFIKRIDPRMKFLLVYLAVYYVFWFLGRPYLRYFIPALSVGAIVLSYGVYRLEKYCRGLLLTAMALVFASNVLFTLDIQRNTQDPVKVGLGIQTRDEYLMTQRPSHVSPYYTAAEWINRSAPANARILVMGDPRGFFLKRRFVSNPPGDYSPIVAMARKARNGKELYEELRNEGFTHLIFNAPELKRTACYEPFYWEGDALRSFDGFWRDHIRLAFSDCADISIPGQKIASLKRQNPQWWKGYSADPVNSVYVFSILPEMEAKALPLIPDFLLDKGFYTEARWKTLEPVAMELRAFYEGANGGEPAS